MNDSPAFGSKEYWEFSYHKLEERKEKLTKSKKKFKYTLYDWYQNWDVMRPYVKKYLKDTKDNVILNTGCGNSDIGEKMWEEDIGKIINIDYSESAIRYMQERFNSIFSDCKSPPLENISYLHMDARKMLFEDEKFDLILDKGTMDAVLLSDNGISPAIELARECYRVLKKGGHLIVVSHSTPQERDPILKEFSWKMLDWVKLKRPPTTVTGASIDHIYILQK
jgi:ubiquinone/menaquinone biosynthesis C-methylase UbiE